MFQDRTILVVFFLSFVCNLLQVRSNTTLRRSSCTLEIENANRTLGKWLLLMRQIILESNSNKSVDPEMSKEASRVQNLIVSFSSNINKKPMERLVEDLVAIRRRSNRLALNLYLKSYDMRWPQTSVQLGVAVERVQQACLSNLDRQALEVLQTVCSYKKNYKNN